MPQPRTQVFSGDVVNGITAIRSAGYGTGNRPLWLYRCFCGVEFTSRPLHVISGRRYHCGCGHAIAIAASKTSHGEGKAGQTTPEYDAWTAMRNRCNNPATAFYKNYGGRGIRVCSRWDRYENFLADMGRKPHPEFTLDRVNNDLDYSPENCRWATWVEQSNNKRNNVADGSYNMSQATLTARDAAHEHHAFLKTFL